MKKSRDDPTSPALKLLLQDHRRIRKLLRRAARAKGPPADLAADVERACEALAAHAEIEERWLYPALRDLPSACEAAREAEVAHDLVRQLAGRLDAMGPGDERFLATVRVMRVVVEHHLEDEEERLFAHARRRSLDLSEVEAAFVARSNGDGTTIAPAVEAVVAHAVRSRDSPAELRQRARGPGRRGAH